MTRQDVEAACGDDRGEPAETRFFIEIGEDSWQWWIVLDDGSLEEAGSGRYSPAGDRVDFTEVGHETWSARWSGDESSLEFHDFVDPADDCLLVAVMGSGPWEATDG